MSLSMLLDYCGSPCKPATSSEETSEQKSPDQNHSIEVSESTVPRTLPQSLNANPGALPATSEEPSLMSQSNSMGTKPEHAPQLSAEDRAEHNQNNKRSMLPLLRAASVEPIVSSPFSDSSKNPNSLRLPSMKVHTQLAKRSTSSALDGPPARSHHHSPPTFTATSIYKEHESRSRRRMESRTRNSPNRPQPREALQTHTRSLSVPSHPKYLASPPSASRVQNPRGRSSLPLPAVPRHSSSSLSKSCHAQGDVTSHRAKAGPPSFQLEVQQSLETIAAELGSIDELSLSLLPARGGSDPRRNPGASSAAVSREALIARRSTALHLLNEVHARCSAVAYTIWCPSEKSIAAYQRHIEEDLSSLQREIAALEENQRPFDQLLLLRRKLLAQRYYWRCRLNNVEK